MTKQTPTVQTVKNIQDILKEIILEKLSDFIESNKIEPGDNFENMGGYSLSKMEIIIAAEGRFGIIIPDEKIAKITNLQNATEIFKNAMLAA